MPWSHQLWYTDCVTTPVSEGKDPILKVVFFRSQSGNEPVREWLLSLRRAHRKVIGQDIKTAQYGWPLGMPLIRKLEPGLWEVRAHVAGGIALSGRNAQKAIGFREGGVQTAESSLG